MKPNTAFLAPLPLLFALAGCSSEVEVFHETNAELVAHVGEPCVLSDEDNPSFSGTSLNETVIDDSEACGTGHCVAWHFQGRASCPAGGEPGDCTTPPGEPVTVSVTPQLPDRPAETAMICSCRCSGNELYGPLCDCPEGFACRDIVDDLGLGEESARYAGGYCVRDD
ncbi:MAG: hypothetical protein JW751_02840 [Polyangiaceae bacterium]|nr:hypothetical protein [Polyangiaceae bacterium]